MTEKICISEMRLSSFRIYSFKSIVDTGECRLSNTDNVLVLAGQNEAGKSAVIEALDFFENGPSKRFEDLHRRRKEHPQVICKYILDENDIGKVFEGTGNERLRDHLLRNREIELARGSTTSDDFGEVKLFHDTAAELAPFFEPVAVPDASVTQAEQQLSAESAAIVEPPKVTNIDLLKDLFLEAVREFVFFNSFDDLLPGEVAVSDIKKHQAILDFQSIFKTDLAEITKGDPRTIHREEQRLAKDASDDLNTYWTQKIEEDSRYNFNVKIVPQAPIETSKIQFMVDRNDEDPLFMEQKSKGFRWFSAFNLRLRALGVNEEAIKNLVLLIDEPGQGLHEKAQRDVKHVIEELGKKGAQVIYTTHHPNLIGTEGSEFARIRIVSNTKDLGTKVEAVAQFASRADVGATDTLSPLITAMGIHSINALVSPDRENVLVEGVTDHYYFSAFRKLLNKSERLFFIPACGVSNIPNLASVLIGWGFDFKAVLDQDPRSGRKAYGLLKKEFYENDDACAHEHIYKLPGCNGVEDMFTPQDFYQLVLDQPIPEIIPDINSKLANGRKEALARIFLEKVNNSQVTLSPSSLQKIEEMFNWLYAKFGIIEATSATSAAPTAAAN